MTETPVSRLPGWAIRSVERLARIHRRRLSERLASDPTVPAHVGANPLRALVELFTGLPDNLLGEPSRARSAFVWVVERYLDGGIRLFEDARGRNSRAGRALEFWAIRKNRIDHGLPDRLDGFPDLLSLAKVTTHRNADDGVRLPHAAVKKAMSIPAVARGTKVIRDDDTSLVVEVTNHAAARYWGSGTHWCTVPSRAECRFYLRRGPLYVIIDKRIDEKYQLHFPSRQFADVDDGRAPFFVLCQTFPDARQYAPADKWASMVAAAWLASALPDRSLLDDVLGCPAVLCSYSVLHRLAYDVNDNFLGKLSQLPNGPKLVPTLLERDGDPAETRAISTILARLVYIGNVPDTDLPEVLRHLDRTVTLSQWLNHDVAGPLTRACVFLLRQPDPNDRYRSMVLRILGSVAKLTRNPHAFLLDVSPVPEVPDSILVRCFTDNGGCHDALACMIVDGHPDYAPVIRRMLDNDCVPSLSGRTDGIPAAVSPQSILMFDPSWWANTITRVARFNNDFTRSIVATAVDLVCRGVVDPEHENRSVCEHALRILRELPRGERIFIGWLVSRDLPEPSARLWVEKIRSCFSLADPEVATELLYGVGIERYPTREIAR